MDEELKRVVRSYGDSFDEVVSVVADAMATIGYSSIHASTDHSSLVDDKRQFGQSVLRLGLLCLHIDNELRASPAMTEADAANGADGLAFYFEVDRVIKLLREAQRTHVLTGRVAAELDGDIDELEEQFMLMNGSADLIESAKSLIAASRPFASALPESVREMLARLERLL